MKAIIVEKYGPPEVLTVKEIEKPAVKDAEVLIRIKATVAAPPDCAFRKGEPFISPDRDGKNQTCRRQDLFPGTDGGCAPVC